MVTDGTYTCNKYSIMYKLFESLGCTPETTIKLYINYTSIKEKKTML